MNPQDVNLKPKHVAMLAFIKQLIDENILHHYNYEELSAKSGLNLHYLKIGFKRLYGEPVFEYLISERLKKAEELLATTNTTIKVIAKKVGYDHPTNFVAAFRRKYKITPQQYRRAQKTKNTNGDMGLNTCKAIPGTEVVPKKAIVYNLPQVFVAWDN